MHVLGTCGHVDHGKSSLLRALTGMEPDRLPEEKKRGMTIDLGFVWLDLASGERVGIVDVPGHQRFVKNMITGTINVDAFLFAVAADDGWMPQSEEHLQILKSLVIRRGIAIVTKIDLVDEARVREVEATLRAKLGADIPCLRFSTEREETIAPLRAAVGELVARLPPPRDTGSPRVWVDRVFLPRGLGVVVTGTLREGRLREGDEITLWPSGKTAVAKSLQSYHQPVTEARPVTRVAIGLARAGREDVERGMLLAGGRRARLAARADAQVTFFGKSPKRNVRVGFHVGTRRELALAISLGGGAWRFKFDAAVPLRAGDRFLLRTAGEDATIGAGVVADTVATSPHRQARELLAGWAPEPASIVALESAARFLVRPEELAERTIFTAAELTAALADPKYRALGKGTFVDKTMWDAKATALKAALAAAFAKKPEPVGAGALCAAWGGRRPAAGVLDALAEAGEIRKVGEGFLPAEGAAPRAETPQTKAARAWLAKGNGEPVTFRDAPADVKKAARELARAGIWVAMGEEFFWERAPYDAIRAQVEAHLRAKDQATTSELKGVCNLSRKIAVLVFEQLDRDRLTYLKDGVRRLLKG